MRLRVKGMAGVAGYGFAAAIRSWMSTLRYEAVFDDRNADPAMAVGGQRIYVVWHENMLAPIYLRAGCNVSILVSQHRDADLLEAIAKFSGYGCVRGSTYRGGATALRRLVEKGRENHLVITPDGPRGPRRRLAPGAVYLASKLGVPIVPMGFAFDRCHRLKSWDRFAIPQPFTTCRVRMGSELFVPPIEGREAAEAQRVRIETELNRVSQQAEVWALTGEAPGEVVRERRTRIVAIGRGAPAMPARRAA